MPSSSNSEQFSSPHPSEFEVSVFGPGIGESIAVHLGAGAWMVVDSCVERGSKTPVALAYLQRMGVDVATAVKIVVVTHWHNDHIRGVAELLREAKRATFVCSAALKSREFMTLLGASTRPHMEDCGIEEFRRALLVLQEEKRGSPCWTAANQLIFTDGQGGEVYALSPSSATQTKAFMELGSLISAGDSKVKFVAQGPNALSVVLRVQVGKHLALLGGDLETTSDVATGWLGVLASLIPKRRAIVFKAPHHGAVNADCGRVWEELLEEQPYVVIAPYGAGKTARPSGSDLVRIGGRTRRLWVTAQIGGTRPPRRRAEIDKALKSMTRERRSVGTRMGHVRIRGPQESAELSVHLFGGAYCCQ